MFKERPCIVCGKTMQCSNEKRKLYPHLRAHFGNNICWDCRNSDTARLIRREYTSKRRTVEQNTITRTTRLPDKKVKQGKGIHAEYVDIEQWLVPYSFTFDALEMAKQSTDKRSPVDRALFVAAMKVFSSGCTLYTAQAYEFDHATNTVTVSGVALSTTEHPQFERENRRTN